MKNLRPAARLAVFVSCNRIANEAMIPRQDVPATLRIGNRQPEKIVLVANSITDPTPTYLALKDALQAAGLGVRLVADARLAPGTFRLVIAPKQP